MAFTIMASCKGQMASDTGEGSLGGMCLHMRGQVVGSGKNLATAGLSAGERGWADLFGLLDSRGADTLAAFGNSCCCWHCGA